MTWEHVTVTGADVGPLNMRGGGNVSEENTLLDDLRDLKTNEEQEAKDARPPILPKGEYVLRSEKFEIRAGKEDSKNPGRKYAHFTCNAEGEGRKGKLFPNISWEAGYVKKQDGTSMPDGMYRLWLDARKALDGKGLPVLDVLNLIVKYPLKARIAESQDGEQNFINGFKKVE